MLYTNCMSKRLLELLQAYTSTVREEKAIVMEKSYLPIVFIGDIHGDLEVLNVVDRWVGKAPIVFLGDYVDRGNEGVEVLTTLLTWKLEQKEKVFLLRGNHEDIRLNSYYGFLNELRWKTGELYGETLPALNTFYRLLPIAFLIDEWIIAVHGGATVPPIGRQELKTIKDESDYTLQLLWNDPCNEEYIPRGGNTRCYTEEELIEFLNSTKTEKMIRAHQYIGGKGIKVMWNEKLYTVFSTRYGNPSARIGILKATSNLKIETLLY